MEELGELGRYKLRRKLGQGGMGEVFLAYDSLCHRQLAVKKIRAEKENKALRRRFLREAVIGSRLMHPSIIPIYSISEKNEVLFYTMPFVEGKSLSAILTEMTGVELDPRNPLMNSASIPPMIRHFLSICNAIDYAHSQNILHRDIKPANVMIGRFGEVYLCDWGIAGYVGKIEEEPETVRDLIVDPPETKGIPGTLPFLAPEMAETKRADVQTEVFALGVMLYLILTLELPFRRSSLEEFCKQARFEMAVPPEEVAPHRDIPRQLSRIAMRALAKRPEERYPSVRTMIEELENYIEGKPEWIETARLGVMRSSDWEFQENVLLAKHIAITRVVEMMEWVVLMISKNGFSGNTRMETSVTLEEGSHGIGFLLSVPEQRERQGLEDGYCLWIGSPKEPGCTLFRNNVEVINIPDLALRPGQRETIAIERVDNYVRLSVNGRVELNYHSHLPIVGSHVGVVYRDADFSIDDLVIFTGSQNIMVHCLSIPDAFLASRDYDKALTEYQRIASSFQGRAEMREAIFRAGITLIEKAKQSPIGLRPALFQEATEQFERLRGTPGAPMEYLGKAMIYQSEGEVEEEIKCLELAVRKYPRHPLQGILEEHILFRLHETSRTGRRGAYRFALLSLLHLPHTFHSRESQRLLDHLTRHWEALPFIDHNFQTKSRSSYFIHLSIQLAAFLAKPITLLEIIENIPQDMPEQNHLIGNALAALCAIGCEKQAMEKIAELKHQLHIVGNFDLLYAFSLFECKTIADVLALKPWNFEVREIRALTHIVQKSISTKTAKGLLKALAPLKNAADHPLLTELEIRLKLFAKEALSFSEVPRVPSSPLFPLYGCYLAATKGEKEALAFLTPIQPDTYPSTYSLLGHYLAGRIDLETGWILHSFLFERLELYRYLELYYTCLGKKRKSAEFRELIDEELRDMAP